MRCVILSGGSAGGLDWLAGVIRRGDRVICVDRGADYAAKLGLLPDLIIGDMDSLDSQTLLDFSRRGAEIKTFPAEKDETDTTLALAEALAGQPDEVVILGALGTRFDHSLANVHLLRLAGDKGVPAKIINQFNEISLVTPGEPAILKGLPGETFSLLPLTAEVTGVNVTGARWPLRDAVFSIGNPYGISNEVAADRVEISITSGLLLLIKINERGEMNCR
ncbi:thiamin pyrophosphokinase [Desulfocucumis palustris]|uniref:Thiamine diphosphokinase n=1 Tax=Desulfocucumis palustris TaxID=1898651 RepID=A0A2L2XCI9_9FIRM|nr:thiamine diphosphokinase [Desulfocucumis palustris]GBF34057.1 thiamin pyrophosphokinase [Desulfocucumis palustris]